MNLWHWHSGNFTVSSRGLLDIEIEFHLRTQDLQTESEGYFIDYIFVRKWCDPEPAHGELDTEMIQMMRHHRKFSTSSW